MASSNYTPPASSNTLRPDRRPLPENETPAASSRAHHSLSHETKIMKYRDKIFALLAKTTIEEKIFAAIDKQSFDDLQGRAHNSQVAIMSDFLGYIELVLVQQQRHGLIEKVFPADNASLGLYLDALVAEGYKYSTVNRHLSSIRLWHRWADLPDPSQILAIRQRLRQLKKSPANRRNQKDPLKKAHLVRAIEVHSEQILRDVADMALLFVAYETACRRSELVDFEWFDLQVNANGTSHLLLRKSKTDQNFEGKDIYLSTVATNLLLYWQHRCGCGDGKIFRAIYSDGSLAASLSTRAVAMAFKRIAKKIGESQLDISGHSTRIGGAIDQLEGGIELVEIMQSGRWKSPDMVLRYTQKVMASRTGMAKLNQQDVDWTSDKILARLPVV